MIAIACVGIVCGVVLAQQQAWFGSIAWLLTGIGMCLGSMVGARMWMVVLAFVGGMLIGLWRGSLDQDGLTAYDDLVGRTVMITGTIDEDADLNQRGQLVLRLRDVSGESGDLRGKVWLTTSSLLDVQRSDRISVSGRLNDGFGSFAASMYSVQITKVTRQIPGDIALQLRDSFGEGVNRALQDTEASLGLGYLVGQRRGLPEQLDTALQAAGLTHIVVASGYNLTILVRLARRLFEKISKYLSLLVSATMIVSFIAITGMSPSMSRAGLVAGLSLLAWYYGRRFHPLVLLPLAATATLLVQPSYAWGDLGWQLSFAAFGGVMILAPLLQVYFFGDKPERPLRRIFIETMSATIATLPILLGSFGQFSIVAPIANMLILPLVPLAMLLTFIAGIGGLVVPSLAAILGFPAQLVLTYMTSIATFMGSVPWAVQEVEIPAGAVIGAYVIIILACAYMHRVSRYDLRRSSLVE